jgi:UDP-N-acetylmuramyl pentapeptide synthase
VRAWAIAYLQILARLYLWRHRPGVVAIAGNQGKTVLKRVLARALGQALPVRANPRSYNTEVGLPLAVLGLEIDPRTWMSIAKTLVRATLKALFDRHSPHWLILELGARQHGDMARLLRTVRPDWAVVTNWSTLEGDSAETSPVMRTEMEALLACLPEERVLMSEDDPLLVHARERLRLCPITLGDTRWTRIRGGYLLPGSEGSYEVGSEWVGASTAYAIQAAVLLGERLGLTRAQIQSFLRAETGALSSGRSPSDDQGLRQASG